MFLPGKRKGPVIAGEAFVLSVQKILRLSSVASIVDSKNPILMQLKIGLVLFEIELVYHCRVGKGCGGPFLTSNASRHRACRWKDYRRFAAICLAV